MPNREIPLFNSMEEMIAWAEKNRPDNPAPKEKKPPKKKVAKRRPAAQSTETEQTYTFAENINKAVSIFIGPGDTWNNVIYAAREERKYAGPNVVIFAHNHKPGEACVPQCREQGE